MFKAPRFDAPETTKQEKTDSNAPTVSSWRSSGAPSAPTGRGTRLSSLLIALGLLGSLAAGFLGGYMGSSHYRNASLTSSSISQQKQIAASQGQLISSI